MQAHSAAPQGDRAADTLASMNRNLVSLSQCCLVSKPPGGVANGKRQTVPNIVPATDSHHHNSEANREAQEEHSWLVVEPQAYSGLIGRRRFSRRRR